MCICCICKTHTLITRFHVTHQRSIPPANENGAPFASCNCARVFPPLLSPQISFVGPGGLPIVLSASPLGMAALCRRCSAKRPHWHAVDGPPLWH